MSGNKTGLNQFLGLCRAVDFDICVDGVFHSHDLSEI